MFERFTDRARRVIVLAQEECRQLGHRSVDVGHIGQAALTVSDGAGLDGDVVSRLREAMTLTLAGLAVDESYTGHIPFTPATKEVFERSLRLSLHARRNYVSSVDLLMAALADPNVNATVTTRGIDYDQVHSRLMQSMMMQTSVSSKPAISGPASTRAELIRGPARHGPWKSVEDVELATLGWVHWHNHQRLHSYLDDRSPAEHQQAFYAAHRDDQQKVEIP